MRKSERELMERIIKSKIEKRAWETVNLPKPYVELLEEIEYIKNTDINPYDLQTSVIKLLYDFYSYAYSSYDYNYYSILGVFLSIMHDKYYINTMATIKLHVNPNILLSSIINMCSDFIEPEPPHIEPVKNFLPSVSCEPDIEALNYLLPHIETVKSFLPRVSPEQFARMMNYEL